MRNIRHLGTIFQRFLEGFSFDFGIDFQGYGKALQSGLDAERWCNVWSEKSTKHWQEWVETHFRIIQEMKAQVSEGLRKGKNVAKC